jgi:hypothetical protein
LASSLLLKFTKPKPLDLPVSLSVITRAATHTYNILKQKMNHERTDVQNNPNYASTAKFTGTQEHLNVYTDLQ